MLTIVDEGSSLTIVIEGLSLTSVNETTIFKKTIVLNNNVLKNDLVFRFLVVVFTRNDRFKKNDNISSCTQ